MHFCRVLWIFLDVDSGKISQKIVVCAGVFLQCSLDALYRGATGHFCSVLEIFLDVDSGKIVVCAGVFFAGCW